MGNVITRQRVSKKQASPNGIERCVMRDNVLKQLLSGELTQGQALRKWRVEVLGVTQKQYANIVKVAGQTLSDLENDKGNYSVATINQVLKPMGMKLGIMPIDSRSLFNMAE